jgi:hypothetical protein
MANVNGDLNKAEQVLRNVIETFLNDFDFENYGNELSEEEVKEIVYLLGAQEVVLVYFGDEEEMELASEMLNEIESQMFLESLTKCRVCGCTELDCTQCIEKDGHPCHWVQDDLCSSCQNVDEKEVNK